MKKLPIDIQTFAELIQENYLYIDKTRHIAELIFLATKLGLVVSASQAPLGKWEQADSITN